MKTNCVVTAIVVLVCVVLLCLIICMRIMPGIQKEREFKEGLSQLEQEIEAVPVYVTHRRSVNVDGNSFSIGDIIEKTIGTEFWDCKVVFADERIWFVYMLKLLDGEIWNMTIASVDREGNNLQTHYSAEFAADQNSQWSPMNIRCRSTYYADEWCYYYDGKIVLTDRVALFEYDLLADTVREYDYASYQHPICKFDSDINESKTITISTSYENTIITAENAAKISPSFAAMMGIGNIDIWDQTPSLVYLFDSVQFDGSNLYIVCRVQSFYGETYGVVFRYDYDANRLFYCFAHHTGGPIGENLYIVPSVNMATEG